MKADLILKSSHIFTGDGSEPKPGCVAIKGNRIIAAGTHADTCVGPETKVMDFGDKLIMPAFIDAHTHYFQGAISASAYMCMDIAASTSEAECVEMVKRYSRQHPEHTRIRGMGWFPANWNDAPLPTKITLDQAFPDKPVYLLAADGHTMWLNTRALQESGITADLQPTSGSVGTFENGELNGLLFEPEAYKPAMEKMMEFEDGVRKEIYKAFNAKLNARGITSVSDMSADDYGDDTEHIYRLIRSLEDSRELSCRLHVFTKLDGYTDFSKATALSKKYDSESFQVSGVKGFIDGVTSTFTGLLLEPYADKPSTCGEGVPLSSKEDNERYITAANKAGLPVRLHCIADGSVRMALDLFEASEKVNGRHGLANTIEHIETIHPDDIPRLAQLSVIASMQPYHLTLDVNEKIRRVGQERCKWEWPHKTILQSGAQLAFGSDYPVVDFNPFPNIYAAVTRCDDEGKPTGVNPQECISLAETLKAYTSGAAKAYSRDDLGLLEEGKLADIIVIDCNLFDLDPMDIPKASVEMTFMDGNMVYRKQEEKDEPS